MNRQEGDDTRERARASVGTRIAVDVIETAIAGAVFYVLLRPGALAQLVEYLRELVHRIAYRVSVWQTRREIQRLPEVDG